MNQFQRTALLLGEDNIEKLNNKTVAIFGVGGVGGYVCEALARTGVGHFVLVDNDKVSLTNINRQIIATHDSIGMPKVDACKKRILSINPNATVEVYNTFLLPENSNIFDFKKYDYAIDCVDTVTAKIEIILKAEEAGINVISSMGAGNKLDPQAFKACDIYKTDTDPLARVMRYELRKRGVKKLKVVYSTEKPIAVDSTSIDEDKGVRRALPGSNAWVPASCGLLIASEVIKDLIK
ncbi:MAG: tRNA threonylcarbamoyladenosine dehydratase [Acholeplasmatales bacterium]|nr:tRNA threonylcarbamoyladenosine dehydratase [Acholeplasmatales bacterium]